MVAHRPDGLRSQHRGREPRPTLATGATWPYIAIGIGFAIVGVFCVGYAFWRYREVEEAVSRGELAPPDERLVALLSGVAPALGVLLVVVLLAES